MINNSETEYNYQTEQILQMWLSANKNQFSALLLGWFDVSGRDLPWRRSKNPYHIWLSEIMLQQTQVKTVKAYYQAFMTAWPTLPALAQASETDILKAWEGLGYYSRARNLLKTARQVTKQYGGQFPEDYQTLLKLPGIGEYTAGALMSIAFQKPYPAVDGNVVRVSARLTAVYLSNQKPQERKKVTAFIRELMPDERPGDFNEALMDLGATVCTPAVPQCEACPLSSCCQAYMTGRVSLFPASRERTAPRKETHVVILMSNKERVRVHRKAGQGLLAGLYGFDWLTATEQNQNEAGGSSSVQISASPDGSCQIEMNPEHIISQLQFMFPDARIIDLGRHRHVFTHIRWHLHGFLIDQADDFHGHARQDPAADFWADADQLQALPVARALELYRQRWLEWLSQSKKQDDAQG